MRKSKSLFSNLNFFTCVLFLASILLGVNAWSSAGRWNANQEEPDDRIIKHTPYPNQPVEINSPKVKGRVFRLNSKINKVSDDWLDNLSFSVKNVSGKNIIHLNLSLDFPETKMTGNIMMFPLRYGQNPRARRKTEQPYTIPPDETADVTLSGELLNSLKTFIEQRQLFNSIKKVEIHAIEVYFDDGTFWSAGSFWRIDANNPQKPILLENQ